MKWVKDGLSIDETKTSTIIIMAIISIGVALYLAITRGDVPVELGSIVKLLALVVAGEYGINSISTVLNNTNLSRSTSNSTLNSTDSNNGYVNYYEEKTK